MKRGFIQLSASFFALLCIVFIPFPFNLTKVQLPITELIFGRLIGFVSQKLFGLHLADTHVHSDTVAMYVLVMLLFVFAIMLGLLVFLIKKWTVYRDRVLTVIYLVACYYLSLQLLKYGLDKVFKNQFYIPEPNTLFTPLGRVPRDLLYWSSMGTSHFYNVFLGSMEVIAAILILVKRSRLPGLLLCLFIMINVVALNFGFDISVKLFSLFLLFLTLYLLSPYIRPLYQFFFTQHTISPKPEFVKINLISNRFFSAGLKWFATGLIFIEAFYPYIKSGNFNGDKAERPYMHGAYEVTRYIAGTDTLQPADYPVKRFFIHRDSYLVFQDGKEEMKDYKLSYDKERKNYMITDYQMHSTVIHLDYNPVDSILTIQYTGEGKRYQLSGKALDWKKLPALQKGFHWTVESEAGSQ